MTRSRTPPDLAGRCPRCWVVRQHCICADLGRAANRTEVVFVRHHWEAHKSTGTARIAALVLVKSRIVELGYDSGACDAELEGIDRVGGRSPSGRLADGAWLLYPGGTALAPGEPAPERLMVIDGTWAQSRRMLRRLPSLQRLRRYSLPPPELAPKAPVLRRSPHGSGHSTIGAVAVALAALEGAAVGATLEHAGRLHAERVLRARHGSASLGLSEPSTVRQPRP